MIPVPPPPQGSGARDRLLLIQARSFGDAVIDSSLIEALRRTHPNSEIMVLTRAEYGEIYACNPAVARCFYAEFPIALHHHRFTWRHALTLARQVLRLRRMGFRRVVHSSGDVRETVLGWLIAPRGNTGLRWLAGHPARRLVRVGLYRLLAHAVDMAADEVGRYWAIERLARALGAEGPVRPRLYDAAGAAWVHKPKGRVIALHPMASQPSRLWPMANWQALIRRLRAGGFEVVVLCAPTERRGLAAALADDGVAPVRIEAGSLQDFFAVLSGVSAAVTLDSFAAHAVAAIGVPGVLINGANQLDLVLPPGTFGVEAETKPDCHPCYNRPTCTTGQDPFACISRIGVEPVLAAIRELGIA